MNEVMKIEIFGEEWVIQEMSEEEEPKLKLMDANGLCEMYDKRIVINLDIKNNKDPERYANFAAFLRRSLRHELFHAIFHEIGESDLAHDEGFIEKMALIYPKIKQVMDKAGV